MNIKTFFLLALFSCVVFCLPAEEGMPTAVSPGSSRGFALIESRCPTFSWSGVPWAQKYRVVAFALTDPGTGIENESRQAVEDDLQKMPEVGPEARRWPVLSKEIAAGALSWTPDISQGLQEGMTYAWCVGALDAGGAWAWSEPKRFRIDMGAKQARDGGNQAGLKEKESAADAAVDAPLETDAGKKNFPESPARPMGTEGETNTFYGVYAGLNNSSNSSSNSFFGARAGLNNTTGSLNVCVGYGAGETNTTGIYNTNVGAQAGYYNTGSYNAFFGFSAGLGMDGNCNTCIGYASGNSGHNGSNNTLIGYRAGSELFGGSDNTFVGHQAGRNNQGSRNVFLGCSAGYLFESDSDRLVIDNSFTLSPLIYGEFDKDLVRVNGTLETTRTGANNVFSVIRTDGASFKLSAMGASGQLGTVSAHPVNLMTNNVKRLTIAISGNVGIGVTIPAHPLHMASGAYCSSGGTWTNASSRVLKENIVDLKAEEAVATLNGLNPVRFTYKSDRSDEQVGFIAEDVPELVATRDRKGMSAMDVVAVLTKVVQEQQQVLSELQAEIKKLKEAAQREK